MVQSIVGTTTPQIPGYACDKNGLVPRITPPSTACDGGGLVATVPNITVEDTAKGFGKVTRTVKDVFIRKPAKNDASQVSTASAQEGQQSNNSNKSKFIATAILLVGGALLGYGHRHQIEKGVNAVKGKVAEWAASPAGEKIVNKGKDLLAKAKDLIFVKA